MSDNIKVVVKVRPLISREIEDKLSFQWKVINNTLYQLDASGKESGVQFTFDKVYDVTTKTADVYKDVAKPIVEAAIAGFNGTIFAYGQTSSGKTYTMSGTDTSPGIIQLAVLNLFERIKCIPDRDFLVRVSYIEIYNETLKDLLNCENDKIKIRDTLHGVKVETTEKFTSSPQEVLDIMREGEANRQTGATNMNEESSRSHSIFQITIESREHTEGEEIAGCVNVSQLNLVDLAGSERAGQTGATGKRFKEGTHINKSLSVLALVIKQLSEGPHKHANYRDSKLTRILQNSLGGNAKTSIICAVTPSAVEETISTLQFANRAKAIKNKPEVNAVATDATKLQDLTKQLSKLQSELAIKHHVEQDNRILLKQIENLQKMILNGFGSMDIGGARRKTWCAPRRMTISTTSLRSVDEYEEAAVQRFCTPSLKYNPLSITTPREFQPIQRASQLPSVLEEKAMVTPPPKEKKVNLNDEIIDLDSDDENPSNTSHCSPYHKCFVSTKTPPCVLRRKAKAAEKDLKDIEELTKREKLYNPEVVEYMEKLEQSTNRVAKLEDEIKSLSAMNVEKDSEVELLKDKITQAKQEVETFSCAKVDLEAQYKACNTKLTDLEVSYETLKTKAKLREEELLSLINEQKNCKKVKETRKSLSRTFEKDFGNFMDMSKDISLVSDNDSSIDSSSNEPAGQLQRLVEEMRTDVTAKNEAIVQLESNILQQRLTIESLESACTELRDEIKKTNSLLKYTEDENCLLKSSIDTLNATINSQKQNLESANNDIQSYNIVIEELQAKLVHKDCNDVHISINDISLEKMINNEEKFIANNENMRNIIHSLRNAIETRNKEIEQLKLDQSSETDILRKQLEEKEHQIARLVGEAEKTKENIQENMDVINKLIADNKDLTKSTDDLSDKLLNAEKQSSELEKRVEELENENKGYVRQLHEFNENHEKLMKNLNSFKENLSITQKEKEALLELRHEVISKTNLIDELKSEISTKDILISTLSSEQMESQDYLCKWRSSVTKVQKVLSSYIADAREEDLIDDVLSLDQLSNHLNSIEKNAMVIVSQKEEAVGSNNRLQVEIADLKSRVESLIEAKNINEKEKETLNQYVIQLNRNLEEIQKDLFDLNDKNADLDAKLQSVNERYDILKHEIIEKEKMITSIKNEENNLRLQLEKALEQESASRNEIENLQSKFICRQTEVDELLHTKSNEIEFLKLEVNKKETLLNENHVEIQRISKTLEESIYNQDQHLDYIYKSAVNLLKKLDDQYDEHQLQNNVHTNVYSNIISILNKATKGIDLLRSSDEINNSEEIKETIALLDVLKEQNQQLISKLSYMENENSCLIVELEQMKTQNMKICSDLITSDETLKQLQNDLHEKLLLIGDLESKINEWKNNFAALEETMKQQLLELQISNSELESLSQNSVKRDLSIKNNEPYSVGLEFTDSENDQRLTISQSLSNILVEPGNYAPQSLLTLCCNKIIDSIQLNETELDSVSSNTNLVTTNSETQTHACACDRLLTEKEMALDENLELKAKIDHLQSVNIDLLKEQEEIRRELKLLMDPAHELQKKISSHKTNLSTLTATTYAENKLLKSQVKVLQHHNNRIYNVCQRDLPGFKKSLQELSSILKNSALVNRLEANIKRFSLPEVLDRNSSAFKDESTLDGDLLMLDTNVTIASVDNTLLAQDQTCLDGTQIYLDTEINTDVIETIDPNILHTQIQMLSIENERLTGKLTALKAENLILHEKIEKFSEIIKPDIRQVDAQSSPMKLNSSMNEVSQETVNNFFATDKFCEYCVHGNILPRNEKMTEEINKLTQELIQVKLENSDLEKKYNTLKDEIFSNDRLALKVSALEKDNNKQFILIDQLTKKLSAQSEEFAKLQDENDQLSTQIMESIGETDDLRKEVNTLKEANKALSVKCSHLEDSIKFNTAACMRCAHIPPGSPATIKSVLNRSRSDSESSSRCNKLSTLQNELLAGREDCRTISEDVASIKNHLERGELTISHDMDLDESMGESNVFAFTKELHVPSPKPNKLKSFTEIPEERSIDTYALDKADCFNYYIEKTGAENNLCDEIRIIEVMKMFYNNLVAKHGNEVENLINNIKDFEESKNQLHEKINQMTAEYSKLNEQMKQKDQVIDGLSNTLRQLRNNINEMNVEFCESNADKNMVLVTKFKNRILSVLDNDFDLSIVNIFENVIDKIVNKYKNDLVEVMDRYSELQGHMELLTSELGEVTENLNQMKCQLGKKEEEFNLLKAQKERVHEITSAVTRDIVQREQDLTKIISNGCQQLIGRKIMTQNDIDTNWPVDKQMSILIEKLIDQSNQTDLVLQEKHNLTLEMTKSKTLLDEKDQELESLKSQADQLHELCKNATNELLIKKEAVETLKSLHEQLDEVYKRKVEENEVNARVIENMTKELDILKATMNEKDSLLQTLQAQDSKRISDESEKKSKILELMESINSLEHENMNLKSVNDMITKESEENAIQLAQADDTIKKNKTELDKLTAEIITLNESLKESMTVIETLKSETKSLLDQNIAITKQFEESNELCSQLKLNIKTHEKTAEIQCKIISRLKQEKETRGSSNSVKESELKEWSQKCESLQKELLLLAEEKDKCQHEAQELREAKQYLERHVAELESGAGAARRRRQSLLDSKRAFEDKLEPDHKKMEAYFSTQEKPDDMFMDVDDHSNRSTPARNRRSDSFQSRHEESEESSRPSSAMARRQRRQSLYDQHRSTHLAEEPSNALDEATKMNGGNHDSELETLKNRLKLCKQELEELKERYREVDEECETCAEYLRERDQQCMQLKVENKDLQQQIAKLNDKLQNASIVKGQKDAQRNFANASVNTDEDWANLHSVVVDRMSFDREVERNKTLQRSVDELRYKNGELKAALAKARKATERAHTNKANLQELESTKLELETCKRELEEYKERCKELDEECETCGEYLRERDEQLCRLKEAKDALEAKLEAIQNKEAGSKVQSVRKKRQSMHDQNRDSAVQSRDAATDTTGDLYMESEHSKLVNESLQNSEIVQLKMALEAVSRQKQALEMQALLPPVLVATGSAIVQNQHLTEVMKENQKLKRMNAKLITICKKRGKPLGESNRENDNPADMG